MYDLFIQLAPVIATAVFGIFGYLSHSYFERIKADIAEIKIERAKVDGKLELLREDIRENTRALDAMIAETKALWRFIDNSHKRASDTGGVNGDDYR